MIRLLPWLWAALLRLLGVRRGQSEQPSVSPLLLLQNHVDALRGDMNVQLGEIRKTLTDTQEGVGNRLQETTKAMGDVREGLGKLEGATAQILEVGQGVRRLEDVLRPPGLRGSLGETLLEQMLSQILPKELYDTQYRFSTGEAVDAIIRLPAGILPIDSKFPLDAFRDMISTEDENERHKRRRDFQNAVKGQVEDISRKYIRPDEGTLDIAFMYIPAENVYYEVILRDEDNLGLVNHCHEFRVVPVSPTSFYGHLQALVTGFRGLRIEENARVVLGALDQLRGDLSRFEGDFGTLGNHVRNAYNKYQDAQQDLATFSRRLEGIERLPGAAEKQLPPPEP